jgi:transcriptional regulator with XRE-family HTH domain
MAKPSPIHAGDPVLVSIGGVIRELRAERGLSQEGLAHEAGVDRSYMGGIERGEHNLTVMNLNRICLCLDVSMSDLLRQAGC